jgi:hypothetical protein
LQGELRATRTTLETGVLTVSKREAHISLLTKHLEKALENEKAAAITRVAAERLMESHH